MFAWLVENNLSEKNIFDFVPQTPDQHFVKVKFKKKIYYTSTVDSFNPNWR